MFQWDPTCDALEQGREQGHAGRAREERARGRLAQQLGQAGDRDGHAARRVARPPVGSTASTLSRVSRTPTPCTLRTVATGKGTVQPVHPTHLQMLSWVSSTAA